MNVTGALDSAVNNRIHGWIKKLGSEDAMRIDIFGDGEAIALNVLADVFRQDLKNAGVGNGCHGFVIPIVGASSPDGILVSVRAAGTNKELLRKVLKDAPFKLHPVPEPEVPQEVALQDEPSDELEGAGPNGAAPVEPGYEPELQGVVTALAGSVLKGRCNTSADVDGAQISLSVRVGGRIVAEGLSLPVAAVGEAETRSAEFSIDLIGMDALARAHAIETLTHWLEADAPAASPIMVSRTGAQGVFSTGVEPVPTPETARRLLDILRGLSASSLLANALSFRDALERSGLWMSGPLTDEEKTAAIDDPALLCFDAAYFAQAYPSHFRSGASAREGLEIFRNLSAEWNVQPNLLLAEPWYRRHRRDIAQTIVCGAVRSGFDHFLEVGLTSSLSPCEWIALAPDHDLPTEPSARNPIVEWLLELNGLVPAALDVRWAGGGAPGNKPEDLRSALQRTARDFAPAGEATVAVPIFGGHLCDKCLVLINTNTATRNYHITRALYQDARALLGADRVHIATYDNLVEICSGLDEPILLCIDGQRLNSDIVKAASRYCSASVLWTFDDPYNLNTHLKIADLFDLICTNDLSCMSAYGEQGFYLPLAAPSALLDDGVEDAREEFDVFFCGTAWPNRVVLMNKLMRDRPHLRYKFALTYNAAVPTLPLTSSLSSYAQSLSFADFVGYARRSRITLSLHRNFSGTDVFNASSNPGPRVFEVAAAGAYQISENGGEGFEALFPPELLTYYNDYDELLQLVDKALAEPDERRASAKRLRDRIATTHTYRHRLSVIIDELARSVPARRAVVTSTALERPKILYVVHNTIQQATFGGLEVHQDILAQNLKNDYEIYFFYTAEAAPGNRKGILANSSYQVLETSAKSLSVGHANLENPALEEFFGICLAKYDFQMVHFFHFINQTPSLAYVARSYGVPYGISFHDFYTACRQFNLLDFSNRYCRNERVKQSDCDICLKKLYKFPERSQLARRDYYGDVIGKASTLMFVSSSTREIHEGIYPQTALAGDNRVHGAPIPNSQWALTRRTERSHTGAERPTRFLVLGNFDEHKGATYLLDAIGACKKGLDIEFHFHGGAHEKVRARYTTEIGERAIFHGSYKPGEVDVGSYDFSLHLSIWPETYCQTLSEAWAARVVPIVTDIGALGQRVEHGINGYKVDPTRPATLARLLTSIASDRKRYLALRENITDDLFLDQAKHAALYDEAYARVLKRVKRPLRRLDSSVPACGATMEALQRRRRTPFWNQGKGKHSANREIVPSASVPSETGMLRPFRGRIEITRGSFDFAGTYDIKAVGSDPIVIKNSQALEVGGWVSRPVDSNYHPVAILRTDKGVFVHTLAVVERPDVAKVIAVPGANFWGMAGNVRMLTPDEIVTGAAEISLGWLDLEASVVHACQKSVSVLGALGG